MHNHAADKKKPLFIAVVGPTGSGKTALGVALAKHFQTEVISADSQLVYQGLDIGTAKPTPEEMAGIPHHMIDQVPPTERYSVAAYRNQALPILQSLREQGKTPLVVGGTGQYIRALMDPPPSPEVPPNPEFRKAMQDFLETHGEAGLHGLLASKDPRRAVEIHPHNTVRVIRALEIIDATGQCVPQIEQPDVTQAIWLGLTYQDRELMRRKLDERIQAMLDAGWEAEVRGLMAAYGPKVHALQLAHGYPQLVKYCLGEATFEATLREIELDVHQYARKQHTWYRQKMFLDAGPDCVHWFSVDKTPFDEIVAQCLTIVKERFA